MYLSRTADIKNSVKSAVQHLKRMPGPVDVLRTVFHVEKQTRNAAVSTPPAKRDCDVSTDKQSKRSGQSLNRVCSFEINALLQNDFDK